MLVAHVFRLLYSNTFKPLYILYLTELIFPSVRNVLKSASRSLFYSILFYSIDIPDCFFYVYICFYVSFISSNFLPTGFVFYVSFIKLFKAQ